MILPDGHGTKVADPILAMPNEEMEIDLKGGNFEWKTFPSSCFSTWALLESVSSQIPQWESRISNGKFYFKCQKPLVSRVTFCFFFLNSLTSSLLNYFPAS